MDVNKTYLRYKTETTPLLLISSPRRDRGRDLLKLSRDRDLRFRFWGRDRDRDVQDRDIFSDVTYKIYCIFFSMLYDDDQFNSRIYF